MTIESWVKPSRTSGFNAIIAKTQSSEYALFFDEGVPQFDIHLDGKYRSAKGTQKMPTTKWTHLAGVYDGQTVKLFVNGAEAGSIEASGKRKTNKLPLFIGADPDNASQPTRCFHGLIDEVRLSAAAIYAEKFKPAKTLEASESTKLLMHCLLYTSPSPRDKRQSRMPSSA